MGVCHPASSMRRASRECTASPSWRLQEPQYDFAPHSMVLARGRQLALG
jgi:hypothetical protein